MPAYWWMYNMFALARNSWKFQNRDKRIHKNQNIEFDPFAPDTIEEILNARKLLEIWTAKASLLAGGKAISGKKENDLVTLGQKLLSGKEADIDKLEVLGENMENTRRKVLILKPWKAYHAYGEILHYYGAKNMIEYLTINPNASFSMMCKDLKGIRKSDWVNLGGQLMQKDDLDKLRSDIGTGKLKSWKDIHNRYNDLWIKYKIDKQKHAFATLCELYGIEKLTPDLWNSALDKTIRIQKFISDQVYSSRQKDYENQFKQTTFRSKDEMKAALGLVDENSFIVQVRKETDDFEVLTLEIKKRK
jgi:hypothetical protein